MLKSNFYKILYCVIFLNVTVTFGQISEGKIIFERKTNLFKKFTNEDTQEYIQSKNKYKTDIFELYFNDSMSLFIPGEDLPNDNLNWTVEKNTVIQNFNQQTSRSILYLWGTPFLIKDSIHKREWKFTDKQRTICKIECMQAVCQIDDSTRIYAWFTSSITPNIGPESYCNLPGAILGLALEDGEVTYFATSVNEQKIDFELVTPRFNDKKSKTRREFIEKARKDFKHEKDIEKYLKAIFLW